MKYFYSEVSNSFYPEDIKDLYDISGTWPSDAIEVEYSVFKQFSLDLAPIGKVRNYSSILGIHWVDTPPLVGEELSLSERMWRDEELKRVDEELNKVQDADPKAKGTVSEWRQYRKSLRAYPETEGFPNKESRPISPY